MSSSWRGAHLQSAISLPAHGTGWSLIGATVPDDNGRRRLVFLNNSTQSLAINSYDSTGNLLTSTPLPSIGAGWTARAVADMDGDGNLDIIATHESTGKIGLFFFGGRQGATPLKTETIDSLSSTGWNVIGAADVDRDGHPDLILQDSSSQQVMVAYLGESNGLTVTATQVLTGSDFQGWTAAGMQDLNGDGHPDLILSEDATGKSIVNYYGGQLGVDYLGSASVDPSAASDWKFVVSSSLRSKTSGSTQIASSPVPVTDSAATPDSQASALTSLATTASTTSTTTTSTTSTPPVLIFNGTGTNSTAVTAIANVVHSLGLAYQTANSSQLNSMTQAKLASYRLFIVPGGNSITIGKYLTSSTTTKVRSAVAQNGLNYLGMCAGAFFGSFSSYYKALNLTSGVWFKFYADYYKGIHKESVMISFPSRSKLDIYWQNGPTVSGWGKVVGRYPNGTPAITEGYWGKGFVILSGVHPEAPASWRYGMSFSTPVDVDLAYAGTLVRAALSRTMLPHY